MAPYQLFNALIQISLYQQCNLRGSWSPAQLLSDKRDVCRSNVKQKNTFWGRVVLQQTESRVARVNEEANQHFRWHIETAEQHQHLQLIRNIKS